MEVVNNLASGDGECDEYAQRLAMDLDMRALADRDWPGGWRRPGYRLVKQPQ
jgi:hypothetical protein